MGNAIKTVSDVFGSLEIDLDFDNVEDACAAFENASSALRGLSDETVIAAANAKKLTAEQLTMLLSIKGLTPAQVAEQLALSGLNKEQVKAIMLSQNYTKEQVEAALATDTFAKATTKASLGTGKLGKAFSALAAKIGISTTALGALVGVLAAVGVGFAIFKAYKADLQESVDNAKTAASAWESSNASLDSQIERLKELDALLKDGNLTEEEAYNVKSELYSIQQSLSESYGDLASGIDLVNGKLSDEIDKVNELSAAWANEFINENRKGGEEAVRQMEKQRSLFIGQFNPDTVSDDVEVLKDIFDKYSEFVGYSDGGDGLLNVYIKGDATEAHDALNGIMTEIRTASNELDSTPILDHFYRNASGRLEDVNEIIENVGDLYEQYKDALLVGDISEYTFGDEKKVAIEWIKEYTDAIEEYNSALASGDPEKIDIAAKNFAEAKNKMDALASGDMSKYADEIADVEDALNTAAIAAYDFNSAMSGDKSKLGWDLSGYADIIKESGLDDIDLLNMIKDGGLEDVKSYFASMAESARDELKKISKDGSVDLLVRPTIDTSLLLNAGWSEDVAGQAGEIATVFTNTFSNVSGDVAINFTPIMADENGNLRGKLSQEAFSEYIKNVTSGVHGDFLNLRVGVGLEFVNEHGGVLSEEALTTYAENVLAGVHDDYLKLQIGAEFTGENAIDEAEAAAGRIHDLHAGLFADGFKNQETALVKVMEAAKDLGIIEGFTADQMDELASALSNAGVLARQAAEDTEEATKSYTDMAASVSSLKSEFSSVNDAISEQGYGGTLSVDTYNSLIKIEKDYASCIEYQNGALQLNAEKANMLFEAKSELKKAEIELQKVTEATKWKENADEIARLTKEYDGLDPAIKSQIENLKKENDGIEANLVGYDLQIAAIEELTSAYGRWKAVSESDNSDSMYKDIQNAYKAIKEAQKTGQTGVGNVVYQAAVELLVPDGEDVKKYMSTLQRYIMDGSNGLNNFVNDMVRNKLMERSKDNWNQVSMVSGVTMQQIIDTMKITPDMAKAIFNALEMYDFDFHWTDEDFNINTDDAMAELKAAQEEMNKTIAKINEMKEAGATVDLATGVSLDDLEKKYAEQKSQVDKLMNSATGSAAENTVEYTITANTEEADTALDAIKGKLEEILKKIEDVFKKKLGDLGGENTLSILNNVLNTLRNINAYKIADKTFTVTQYTTTTGTKPYGSISSHDQNIKNDTSAHAAVASGTKYADAGIALVGDEYSSDGSPKPELIITDGAAYVAGQSGPEFVHLKDGDQVVPASETEKILQRNPDIKRDIVPAFATGAGGWPAGSVSEDKYLEGVIGPTQEWLNQQKEAQKKKDDELIKQLSAKAAEKSADDTYLNTIAKENYYVGTTTKHIDGDGDQSSLRNYGSGGSGGSGGSDSSDSSSTTKEKSAFEKEYDSRNHLLAMERADYEEYIDWLEGAYKDAYNKGEIELEDFYRYEQEVFEGRKELFQDSIGDIEHKIKALERDPGNETQIINYYNQIISKIDTELAAARARGLNDDDDYVQELLEQKWDYADEIKDIQDEITENAKDAVEDLIDYRMDMLKQDLENERDAIGDKLDTLRDFYDKQKEMLQDVYDEEKYLEEQSEKRKSVDDIRAEMDMLRFDDSAKAQKRLEELQEELNEAEKELADFEKDHAFESATDLLDKMYEQQESQMQSEMDALEEKLNDPNALYNQALRDIQNNTLALYEEMIKYNNKYGLITWPVRKVICVI